MLIDSIAATTGILAAQPVGARPRQDGVSAETTGGGNTAKSKAEEVNLSFPAERETDLESALNSLDKAIQPFNLALNFSRDEETGTIVIKLVDQTTGETVNQIPSEVQLHLTASLGKLQGQLVNRVA